MIADSAMHAQSTHARVDFRLGVRETETEVRCTYSGRRVHASLLAGTHNIHMRVSIHPNRQSANVYVYVCVPPQHFYMCSRVHV